MGRALLRLAIVGVAAAVGCASGSDRPREAAGASGIGSGPAGAETTTADGSETGAATDDAGNTASADETTSQDVKLDVNAPEGTGSGCSPPEDICCLMDGEVPPHALLDAFLAAYPPPNMPKTVPDIEGFDPIADGNTMAWHETNSGDELIDPTEGGVTPQNVEAGRSVSRAKAETVMPPGSMLLDVRDEAVIIENPDDENCTGSTGASGDAGIGWGWGSILFEAPDESIHELVYLYIGYCKDDGDNEGFLYSDAAVEICAPPG